MTIHNALQKIRYVLTDVDGVLTDGRLYFDGQGETLKVFHVRDGSAIKRLRDNNIEVGILSGRSHPAVNTRLSALGVTTILQGIENKLSAFQQLKTQLNLPSEAFAYIGDDYPDLPVLQQVGFSVTVPEAPHRLRESVDYCSETEGGHGVIAEVCELILTAQTAIQEDASLCH